MIRINRAGAWSVVEILRRSDDPYSGRGMASPGRVERPRNSARK